KQQTTDGSKGFSSADQANLLAESRKRRIDPNDLYNIVIRPSKGEGRVEIILPTGGPERAERADEQWRALVKEMKQEAIKELEKTVGKGADLKGIEKE